MTTTDEAAVTVTDDEPSSTNGRPGAPRSQNLSSGDGEVIMQWLPPRLSGGRPILRYEYRLGAEFFGKP